MTNDPEKLTGFPAIMRESERFLSKLETKGYNRIDVIISITLFVCALVAWLAKYSVGFSLYLIVSYVVFSFYLMQKNIKVK